MRLDKFLCDCGIGSRKEVHNLLKNNKVTVNDIIVKSKDYDINQKEDIVCVNEIKVEYEEFHYIMMHKPSNYVTSTKDKDQTVMELLGEFAKYKVAPVGRLDKDTEGLLLFTDDGILAHFLTSPKHHVEKKYYAKLQDKIDPKCIELFKQGIVLEDGYQALPSTLEIIDDYHIYLTIVEGKFHQVKRMLEAVNNKVIFLKRITFGPLHLDDKLKIGTVRKLTEEEVNSLLKYKK